MITTSRHDLADTDRLYIRLVEGKGLISALIEFKDSEWPSHVELIRCDQNDVPIETLGSRYPAGVQYRSPKLPVRREAWYLPVSAIGNNTPAWSQAMMRRAWFRLSSIIGQRYDLIDIFGIATDQDWHTDGRWICSESVAYGFEQDHQLFPSSELVRRIRPAHYLLTLRIALYKRVVWT